MSWLIQPGHAAYNITFGYKYVCSPSLMYMLLFVFLTGNRLLSGIHPALQPSYRTVRVSHYRNKYIWTSWKAGTEHGRQVPLLVCCLPTYCETFRIPVLFSYPIFPYIHTIMTRIRIRIRKRALTHDFKVCKINMSCSWTCWFREAKSNSEMRLSVAVAES